MKESFINEQSLPLVIEPTKSTSFEELLAYVKQEREAISEKVLKYGGVLLRGFPIVGAEGFNRVIETLDFGKQLDYIGGDSPRDKVKDKVYTSTDAPPGLKIPLHNEMSFAKLYPRHIYFYCHQPAAKGGATILGDAREICRKLDPRVRQKFVEKGLHYISNYYKNDFLLGLVHKLTKAHKPWTDVFETKDKKKVEEQCRANDFSFSWRRNDWIQVCQKRPATMKHEITGEEVWFNQAHLFSFNPKLVGFWNFLGTKLLYARPHTIMHEIAYGDGAPIARQDLYHVMDLMDRCTISYPWQQGDMIILDNVLAMHGRASFSGKRKVLTALTR